MDIETTLILNTHMPDVLSKGDIFCEPENWLFEAITETYIPLLTLLETGAHSLPEHQRLVISTTPCLLAQLDTCSERYLAYLDVLQTICEFELERSESLTSYNRFERHPKHYDTDILARIRSSAQRYSDRISASRKFLARGTVLEHLRNLVQQRHSQIEFWTSTPHHNFLPFFSEEKQRFFIQQGIVEFETRMGSKPDGFWLPECAYRPGIEKPLTAEGVTKTAVALPAIAPYRPDLKSGSYRFGDLECLVHDFRASMHVWQAPSDTLLSNPAYREFYRDLGHDVKPEYFAHLGLDLCKRKLAKDPVWTGIKYHAISGPDVELGEKSVYCGERGQEQVRRDVDNFWSILDRNREITRDRRHFVLAFDTELFGHWWHEGVEWLGHLWEVEKRLSDEVKGKRAL